MKTVKSIFVAWVGSIEYKVYFPLSIERTDFTLARAQVSMTSLAPSLIASPIIEIKNRFISSLRDARST